MLNLGLGIKVKKLGGGAPPPPARDPDTTAFMNATGIPDDSTVYYTGTPQEITGTGMWDAIDGLITDIKDAGLWSDLQAFYPFIGGTASTHKWNLKDPRDLDAAFRIDWFGGLTHDRFGITGNALNGYGNTHITPSTDINGSNSFGFKVINNVSSKAIVGSILNLSAGEYLYLYPRLGTSLLGTQNENVNTGSLSVTNNSSNGNYRFTSASNNHKAYKDNSLLANRTNAAAFANIPIYIFALNTDNAGAADFSDHNGVCFDFYKKSLTSSEVTDINTAINTFETALNR